MSTQRSVASKIKTRLKRISRSSSDAYAHHFNTPVKFAGGDWQVNERIVEWPYVFSRVGSDSAPLRILELGCTRSHLAISLASMGHQVTGVDLRPYPFHHPNLTFFQGDVLAFAPSVQFDWIVSVSVLEHIGLGAYGENQNADALKAVIDRLTSLLCPGGRLIVTVPFGRKYVDDFLRSFTYAELSQLFHKLNLVDETYYRRDAFKYWIPCDRDTAATVSNARDVRGRTGVNCVGCFTWLKPGVQP